MNSALAHDLHCERDERARRLDWFDDHMEHYQPCDALLPLVPIMREVCEQVTQREWDFANHWTQYGFDLVNTYLRSGSIARRANKLGYFDVEDVRERISALDRMMRPLPHDLVVYRGTNGHLSSRRGDGLRVRAFLSTSADEQAGERFARVERGMRLRRREDILRFTNAQPQLMEIHLPAGMPIIALGASHYRHEDEQEVIVARGARLVVESTRRERGGMRRIVCRAQLPAAR